MKPCNQGSARSLVATDTGGKPEGDTSAELDFERTWDRYIHALDELRRTYLDRQAQREAEHANRDRQRRNPPANAG